MISLIIIIISLICITIISNYVFILTEKQMNELIIGTLSLILMTYIRNKLLNFEIDTFLPALLFMIWYFSTTLTANLINKDGDVIRDNKQTTGITISTILFMFLIMFIRPLMLNEDINSDNVVLTTLLLFLWSNLLRVKII